MDASPQYRSPSHSCSDFYYTAAIRSTKKYFINEDGAAEKSGAANEDFKATGGLYRGKTT